jgi:hypothetical protein
MTARPLVASSAADLLDQIREVTESGMAPTLALVFADLRHDLKGLVAGLSEYPFAFVGASTDGGIADGQVHSGATVALLLDLDPGAFALFVDADNDPPAAAARLGTFAGEAFDQPQVLAFASGLFTSGDDVVANFQASAGTDVPFFGGYAGSNFSQLSTHILTRAGVLPGHLAAVVFDGQRLSIDSVATSGWKPVGEEMTITRAEGHTVYELDGRPILDVFNEHLKLDRDRAVNIGLIIRQHLPLAVRRADGTTVLRASAYVAGKGEGVIFAGDLDEGDRVRFCAAPDDALVERLVADAETVRARSPHADAVLLLSCRARHAALGTLAEAEAQAVAELWNAPQVGFFAYGEFGAHPDTAPDFHNSTCSLITLRSR